MANITKVDLLALPLDKDYMHTLYFETQAAQREFFAVQAKKTYTDFTYQRKDNVLRIPAHIDELYAAGCNYVTYQNPDYENKWFYAFIEDMQYLNDKTTAVKIKTDCIQTWMFDVIVKPSFVEREHAATDEVGEHTIDEALETGEYVINNKNSLSIGDEMAIVAAVTKTSDGKKQVGRDYHGIYSGVAYIPFQNSTDFESFVKSYDAEAAADAITMVFLAPKVLLLNSENTVSYAQPLPESKRPVQVIINKPSSEWTGYAAEVSGQFEFHNVDGYYPRNNKVLCYPYRYLLASNNGGGNAMYKFEKFKVDDTILQPCFVVSGCITPGCSVRMVPVHYNGVILNDEEGLNAAKYPMLNWTSDAFTNWLTQNSVNIGIDIAAGAAQLVGGGIMAFASGGLAAGAGATTAIDGLTSIAKTVGQIHQQSLVPPQAKGNMNAGDIVTAMGNNEFKFYTMTIKAEYAKIIDEFFDMYGYKCHRVKVPEKNHRPAYWYTKTINANIVGAIPQDDLQTIKDCYDRGITFWKNPNQFRDYSVHNSVVVG